MTKSKEIEFSEFNVYGQVIPHKHVMSVSSRFELQKRIAMFASAKLKEPVLVDRISLQDFYTGMLFTVWARTAHTNNEFLIRVR